MRKNNRIWLFFLLCMFLGCKHGSENLNKLKESNDVYLRSLKINGYEIEITDEIDLKKTKTNT